MNKLEEIFADLQEDLNNFDKAIDSAQEAKDIAIGFGGFFMSRYGKLNKEGPIDMYILFNKFIEEKYKYKK